jgi:hypothetical protein
VVYSWCEEEAVKVVHIWVKGCDAIVVVHTSAIRNEFIGLRSGDVSNVSGKLLL